jgi:hypothetical protein
MSRNFIGRSLLVGLALLIRNIPSFANTGKPGLLIQLSYKMQMIKSPCDTVPENKPPEQSAQSKQSAQIKEVPKARKQATPVAVPANTATTIKPIKIIKPKIIKPVIKIN